VFGYEREERKGKRDKGIWDFGVEKYGYILASEDNTIRIWNIQTF
jgi:hypothetical protein